MKKFLVLILVSLFIMGVVSTGWCQDAEIKQTVKNFYNGIETGNVKKMLANVTPKVVKQIADSKGNLKKFGDLGGALLVAGFVNKGFAKVDITKLKVKINNKGAEKAKVTTNFDLKMTATGDGKVTGEKASDIIKLKKVNGRWLIYDIISQK
ncbi:MAG: hypothetical protein K8T10_02460 [Candidatus Eremiobacteraeota bacterium]|nr:hypothetical protein [Candidatus Eremiobacteraeota bacterium]